MISDVLSDAGDEIERYQREFRESYSDTKEEIGVVLEVMEALRLYYDSPEVGPENEHPTGDLLGAIRRLDLTDLRRAKERFSNRAAQCRSNAASV